MSSYINTQTNFYPVSEAQIRAENPNSAFGVPFAPPAHYKVVLLTAQPSVNALTHYVREAHPVLGPGGDYLQQWEVVEFDQAQKDALLAQAKDAQWQGIKAIRDDKVVNGGYKVGNDWFHSDLLSRSQQTALVIMGANIPVDLNWKTMAGTFVVMTQELAADIFAAAAASDQSLFAHAEVLRAQVNAAADPYAVDIYAGWPEKFGDA
jgi:hypothetical protein